MNTHLRSPEARKVIALLATRGRFELLAKRAVPSILAQSRLPDQIMIVMDQTTSELSNDALKQEARRLRALCRDRIKLTILRNRRTSHRAAAAWNTAIDELHRKSSTTMHGRPIMSSSASALLLQAT
jgi:hypothetical protein